MKIEKLEYNSEIQELYLASNSIKQIEGLSDLKHLKVLELGFNKIEVIIITKSFLNNCVLDD